MEKYMGNKSKMTAFIFNAVNDVVNCDEKIIFDAFSGTTNVGKYFKSKDYSVVTNDVNDFSNIFGKSYICNNSIPNFNLLLNSEFYSKKNYMKVVETESFKDRTQKLLLENKNTLGEEFLNEIKSTNYLRLLVYLTYYSTPADYDNICDKSIKKEELYEFLERNYTEKGINSKYINLVDKKTLDKILNNFIDKKLIDEQEIINDFYAKKDVNILKQLENSECVKENPKLLNTILRLIEKKNIVGYRKFFSIEHAKRLDIIMNTIWYWKNNNLLEKYEYEILLTSVIESIAIFSNTSATYQAFYKDYCANTMQSFRLVIPTLVLSNESKHLSLKGDIFKNINEANYDILYLDPPYNWRQYDSNYHLLNTIAKLNDLDDVRGFEKGIAGASGENREQKMKYTSFNQSSTFEKRLFQLIEKAKCKVIVLSYSDSESNHNVNNSEITIKKIEDFLNDDRLFITSTYQMLEFKRQNFESRKFNKKQKINELLFIVRKK